MKKPDGNTAALNEYEAKQAEAERAWAALEPEARQDVLYAWWQRVSMESVAEALYTLTAADSEAFLGAFLRYQYADAGALLTDALDRAERHAPNPGFCYTPERCAGKTCCPHNPSCTE